MARRAGAVPAGSSQRPYESRLVMTSRCKDETIASKVSLRSCSRRETKKERNKKGAKGSDEQSVNQTTEPR